MENLLQSIQVSVTLNGEEKTLIKQSFQVLRINKGDFFIQSGQFCYHVAFISSGKFRVYYDDDEGNEVTCYFVSDGQFISSFTSFLTQIPTKENIEVLEDTDCYVSHRDELEKLCIAVLQLQIWRRDIAENLFILMEKRIAMLQSHSA